MPVPRVRTRLNSFGEYSGCRGAEIREGFAIDVCACSALCASVGDTACNAMLTELDCVDGDTRPGWKAGVDRITVAAMRVAISFLLCNSFFLFLQLSLIPFLGSTACSIQRVGPLVKDDVQDEISHKFATAIRFNFFFHSRVGIYAQTSHGGPC